MPDALERVGPPAKSELPVVRGMLAFDEVQAPSVGAAAKALLREAVSEVKDPVRVQEAIRDDPSAGRHLVAEAIRELEKRKAAVK